MSELISGKVIGASINEELRKEVDQLKINGIEPCLAVVLVGEDPASEVYVRNKKRTCGEIGIRSIGHDLPASTTQEELENLIQSLNDDPAVHGILCQFPLPEELDETRVILTISPDKDVDGLHPLNAGLIAMGQPKFISCTPYGVLQMLKRSRISTSGKNAVVLGRSNLVGRPIATLLSSKGWDATVTVCHSRTANLAEVTSQADIMVAAIGIPEFVKADMVKPGAVVIDVGINRIDDPSKASGSRMVGDVAFKQVEEKASFITPVPGGVGPMTIAMLMANTVNAARWLNGMSEMDL
ncbi:MAG: bifunctional methylenetetrahydrofolate dehydrogenase/methenyltetrahydrofolate cyclohydrolase FolD [Deltaproteobacteria bacterium]|jgi:methylenetetrahydrofolate dehydrogenase (NADP+)/methenyltetrahydrofolate cyclohydrolase|nr:bifunctional methylenetetrahydrofolate dehydrogenase/methenyltetrahydrofolate cyclohydrolase FolD [Deltaproteobacteria bacterium]MDP6488131.1 bifunctional methylenetetrahydrofolate dehydrogenase/methenyltetrahydrofolate cyclohydrolase FolD [SAR324 cluster bacterium]MDP7171638.1 bifunctional methylenetetrahydrofolate dehydrogenase/methenyltetrahydrofolate cyclohydrolase FolD [SAR324 cluster bacterium]MDP7175083.1 bifunctional methylenetetrahydrofolate dehydrogenase/methenyltetrahydrofolate cyc|tara:strand:+ start:2560 stop:3450 length:891 start_codon:yes stop_codon:yes gene_type:complete